jgi:hypothetical protein
MAISLLDWISNLLREPGAREDFQRDPDRYAEQHGFADLSHADVHDALSLIVDDDHYAHGQHYPLPRHHDSGQHENGAHYLRGYIRDNHESFDRHDTDVDNSVHQDIDTGGRDRDGWDHDGWDRDNHDRDNHDGWNHDRGWEDDRGGWNHGHERGGDFQQVIDNDPVVASGDHSVAARDDIRDASVSTGDGNAEGHNDHALSSDDNSTAFGAGDATDANVSHFQGGHGGSLSLGGSSYGHSTDSDTHTSVHNSGSGSTAVNVAGDHGYADQYADQRDTDHSTRSNYEDHSVSDHHNSVGSHNDSGYQDSHDYDVHHG